MEVFNECLGEISLLYNETSETAARRNTVHFGAAGARIPRDWRQVFRDLPPNHDGVLTRGEVVYKLQDAFDKDNWKLLRRLGEVMSVPPQTFGVSDVGTGAGNSKILEQICAELDENGHNEMSPTEFREFLEIKLQGAGKELPAESRPEPSDGEMAGTPDEVSSEILNDLFSSFTTSREEQTEWSNAFHVAVRKFFNRHVLESIGKRRLTTQPEINFSENSFQSFLDEAPEIVQLFFDQVLKCQQKGHHSRRPSKQGERE